MTTKIDQKEYLKKYLSGDTDHAKKKKKKSKASKTKTKVKIIDDDEHKTDEIQEIEEGEDAPQIVGEYFETAANGSNKWRSFAVKEEKLEPDDGNAADVRAPIEIQRRIKVERVSTSPDMSPPRRKLSTEKSENRDNDQNARRQHKSEDKSHRKRYTDSADHSPVRKRRDESDSPRRARRSGSRDIHNVPKREKRYSCSPPMRNDDLSPPRRRQRSPSSPRRRKSRDLSPVRKRRNDSPRSRKHSTRADQSPVRRRHRSTESPDNSPPRLTKSTDSKVEQRNSCSPPPTHKPKITKTLDGKRAGLQNASSLRQELDERRKREAETFSTIGRDAEVNVRSTGRLGKRAREALALDPEQQKQKELREQQKQEVYSRWGKGLKQIEDHRARLLEQEYEGNKPLARYSDDADLEQHLREQERMDDPMLDYIRQKKRDRQKDAKVLSIPLYEGTYPENRFGIRPGYRWDGVDRSNGYEDKWFNKQNEKLAIQDEAYKYSVEDM